MMDRIGSGEKGVHAMRRTKSKDMSREGEGSSPPRFASEALSVASPHQVELEVQRALLAQPMLRFSSLVVRRINDGVCLQGVLEADADSPDVCTIAQRVSGVRHVLNHLVIAGRCKVPGKG
jgi:osmotically-inducible protein OsmY